MTDIAALRRLVSYNQSTGAFIRRKSAPGLKAGERAGDIHCGYRRLMVGGRRYSEHRLAWAFVYGEFPAQRIDHINGDGTDNRISNLRLATASQNGGNRRRGKNNQSGLKGVHCVGGKWQAQIEVNRKKRNLGTFDTPEEAHAAYMDAAICYFGPFARAA